LLDEIGLTLLAEVYELQRDGQRVRVSIKELTREEVVVGPLPGDLDPTSDPVDLTARWAYTLRAPALTPLTR